MNRKERLKILVPWSNAKSKKPTQVKSSALNKQSSVSPKPVVIKNAKTHKKRIKQSAKNQNYRVGRVGRDFA